MCVRVSGACIPLTPQPGVLPVARRGTPVVIRYFNDIFDGLCRLVADMDPEVKTGAGVLNRKMKDIVTGVGSPNLRLWRAPCAID